MQRNMSAAGPSQGANSAPAGGSERSERGGPSMSAAGLSQGANSAPLGGSAAAELPNGAASVGAL
jgi:hypothetical protein